MCVTIPSFLHSSLHPSICEPHYAIPFLSRYILIAHILLAPPFMHSAAFFLSASYHDLPFPPFPFNASIYKSHYISPKCFYHYGHPFTHLITLLPMHISMCISLCTSHYGPVKHAHGITPLSSVRVALHPSMFASHYVQYSEV